MSIEIFSAQKTLIEALPNLYEGDIYLSRITVGTDAKGNVADLLTHDNQVCHMYGFSWTLNINGTLEGCKGFHEIISGFDLADALNRFNRFIRCMASGKSYGEAIRLADTLSPLAGCYEGLPHTAEMMLWHCATAKVNAKKNAASSSHPSRHVFMTLV